MGSRRGFVAFGNGSETYAWGRPSTSGRGLVVWLNPLHQPQADSVLALAWVPLPVTGGTIYRAKPMLIAVFSCTRIAAPTRGRKMFLCVTNGLRFCESEKIHAPLNVGFDRATRSAGITGGLCCSTALGTVKSRYRE